jgi:putative ABC transport system permease protein
MIRSLHGLALRNLLARRLRTGLTGVAIMLGVAAVFATSLIGAATQARTAELARQGSRASLQVSPRDGETFDARILDLVRAHADVVSAASPELQFTALVNGAPLIILGVDPAAYLQMEAPEMAQGRYLPSPTVQWAVVAERWAEQNEVRVGDRLTIPLNPNPVRVRVVGLLKHKDTSGAILDDRTALVPLNTLQALMGQRRRLGRIKLALPPGSDPARAESRLAGLLAGDPQGLGQTVVVARTGDGGQSELLNGMIQGGLVISGVVILLAAAFLIFNTFAMSVAERTREIGILRALGLGRGGVLRGVLVEAGILGLGGALAGLPVGWLLAQSIVGLLVAGQGFETGRLAISPPGLLTALLVGLAVALAAALLPARVAAAVAPLAAILGAVRRHERLSRGLGHTGWAGLALLLATAGVVSAIVFIPAAQTLEFVQVALVCVAATLLAMAAGLLLLPALAAHLLDLLRRALVGRLGMVGRLAGDQLVHNPQRSMLTAGTLAVGLAMVVTLSGVLGIVIQSAEDLVFGLMRDDYVLMYLPSAQTLEAADPRSPVRQREWPRPVLAAIDAVRDQAAVYSLSVTYPAKDLEATPGTGLYALDDLEAYLRVGSFRYEQGNLETALRILRQGRGLLIMPATARRLGVGVGDTVWVNTRHGTMDFHVAAVGGCPWFGTLISRADADRYFGVMPPLGYMVTARPGMDRALIRSRLQAGLKAYPDYVLFALGRESDAIERLVGTPLRSLAALLNGISLLALVIASLGQVNTTTMCVIERVRELGVLRAAGMTRSQVLAMVLLEAAVVGLVGAVVGGLVGLVAALSYALTWSTGGVQAMGFGAPTWETVRTSVDSTLGNTLPPALLALVAAPLITALAAWRPARQAAALPIVEAIRRDVA